MECGGKRAENIVDEQRRPLFTSCSSAQSAILIINGILHIIIGAQVRIFLFMLPSLVTFRCGKSKQLIRIIRLSALVGSQVAITESQEET